jgi:hypothetical protein
VDAQRISVAMLGIGASLPLTRPTAAAPAWQFHPEVATIEDVHRAIRARQITVVQNLWGAKERIVVREM